MVHTCNNCYYVLSRTIAWVTNFFSHFCFFPLRCRRYRDRDSECQHKVFIKRSVNYLIVWQILYVALNSSPIDERWEMVPRKLVGAWRYRRQSREVSMATQRAGTTPASSHQRALSHWQRQWKPTYLIPYLPKPQPAKRVGGVGARFHSASPSELRQDLPRFATDALA